MNRLLVRIALSASLLAGLGTLILFRAMMDHNNQGEFFDTATGVFHYKYILLVVSLNLLSLFIIAFIVIAIGVFLARTFRSK